MLGTPCSITVRGVGKVVPAPPRNTGPQSRAGGSRLQRGSDSPTRLRAMFTSFAVTVDGQERCVRLWVLLREGARDETQMQRPHLRPM